MLTLYASFDHNYPTNYHPHLPKMVTFVKTMSVFGITMLFFVATTIGNEHPDVPCCDGEYTSCCKPGDSVNITTYANVTTFANTTTYAKVDGNEHPDIPCCDGEYTSCCKTGDAVNITTYA